MSQGWVYLIGSVRFLDNSTGQYLLSRWRAFLMPFKLPIPELNKPFGNEYQPKNEKVGGPIRENSWMNIFGVPMRRVKRRSYFSK